MIRQTPLAKGIEVYLILICLRMAVSFLSAHVVCVRVLMPIPPPSLLSFSCVYQSPKHWNFRHALCCLAYFWLDSGAQTQVLLLARYFIEPYPQCHDNLYKTGCSRCYGSINEMVTLL